MVGNPEYSSAEYMRVSVFDYGEFVVQAPTPAHVFDLLHDYSQEHDYMAGVNNQFTELYEINEIHDTHLVNQFRKTQTAANIVRVIKLQQHMPLYPIPEVKPKEQTPAIEQLPLFGMY